MRMLYAAGGSFSDQISPAAEGAYEAIRRNPNDVAKIAKTMNLPVEVVERAKKHLFLEKHTLSTFVGKPSTVEHFVALEEYAELWQKAELGTLTSNERDHLLNLLVHENVEARLKARGLPLLEPADAHGDRPFRGELAHDLAGAAENNFAPRIWSKVPEPTKKKYLRALLEGVFEVRGVFAKDVEQGLPADVRAEYQKLLMEKGR